jgi:hypothetical protein
MRSTAAKRVSGMWAILDLVGLGLLSELNKEPLDRFEEMIM